MQFKPVTCPETKMGVVKFSGASDDIVSVEGWMSDEFSPDKWFLIGKVMLVRLTFENVGTGWVIQTAMQNEDVPVPFPVRIEYAGYSPILIVECPVGTSVEIEDDGDDEDD